MLQRPGQVGLRHVLADLADLRGSAAVGLQKQRERLHRRLIATLDREHRAALVQIGEHRHVVLPPPRAGLVDPEPLQPREVLRIDRGIDMVMQHPPDTHVRFADQLGDRRDRHLLDQRHHQRLEQQREPRPLPRPRHLDLMHSMLGTVHARHPRRQERPMLEEVQMPPRLRLGVARLQPRRTALRAAKHRPAGEVDPQIQPALIDVEAHLDDLPRRVQPKRLLKEVDVMHTGLPSSKIRSTAGNQLIRTLPTQNVEEPNCRRLVDASVSSDR